MAVKRNLRRIVLLKKLQSCKSRQAMAKNSLLFLLRHRKMLLLRVSFLTALLLSSRCNKTTRTRSCRRLPRNLGWFDKVWNKYSEARFKKTFRISKRTFKYILGKIEHDLLRQTLTEEPLSPAFRLGVCLYRLARGDYYYTISELAGIGRSTVCTIVDEVTDAIIKNLWEDHVLKHFPKDKEQFKEKILDMEELWQFPFCWGAIDGSHIPIKCPAGGLQSCKEYHNFKNFYSIVLMAMVDAKYRFIWASCGFPGNSHDSIILQSTQLWREIKEENLIPAIGQQIDGVTIPPLLIGDSAFPFQPWMMKPFTKATLSPEERNFNYRLSRARMVTEGAYGQLKGRWRVLFRKCESPPEKVKMITLACLVLHNICLDKGETLPRQCDLTIDPKTNARRDRKTIRNLLHMTSCTRVRDNSQEASGVRDALLRKLWRERQNVSL